MSEEMDVNIFVTRDSSKRPGEADYFAEVCRLNNEGERDGEPLYTTKYYHSAGAAIAEAEYAWQESGGGCG